MVTVKTEFKIKDFPNYGYLISELSEELLAPIKQEIDEIRNNFEKSKKANVTLIGHIKKEFNLIDTKDYLESLLAPLFKNYERNFKIASNFKVTTRPCSLVLDTAWVNFQEKYEFNPVHKHSGIFSFVIWMQIPYLIEEEKKVFQDLPSHKNRAGCFEFQYSNILGEIWNEALPVDKSYENKIIIFPANLCHAVYPFYTSDDYRISISGNLSFKT